MNPVPFTGTECEAPGAGGPVVQPECQVEVPAGVLTPPWHHQKTALKFCLDKIAAGFHGILLAMGMGCIEGDAVLTINRRGGARCITLREFHRKFHGGKTNGRPWRDFPTRMRSMIDGELRLKDVLDVIARGVKPVVLVTLASGKALRVTSDHEFARPDGAWTAAGRLAPGDAVLTNGVPGAECVQFIPKRDTVVSVEPDGDTDVYDLKMAGLGHNFVANGIIVHNCGKSLVACMLVLALAARQVLIACPLRVVPVWLTQFARHVALDLVIVALDEDAGSVAAKRDLAAEKLRLAQARGVPFIAVVNYESIWREPFASWAENQSWDLVVADEAHRLKSAGGKASLFFKRLRLRAAIRVALTGTPMPHGPKDIYPIFRFLDIRIFGPSFAAFRSKFCVMGGYGSTRVSASRSRAPIRPWWT